MWSDKENNSPGIWSYGQIAQARCWRDAWRWEQHLSDSFQPIRKHALRAEINSIPQPGTGDLLCSLRCCFFEFPFTFLEPLALPSQASRAPFSWLSDLLRGHPHFWRPLQDGKTCPLILLHLGRILLLFFVSSFCAIFSLDLVLCMIMSTNN